PIEAHYHRAANQREWGALRPYSCTLCHWLAGDRRRHCTPAVQLQGRRHARPGSGTERVLADLVLRALDSYSLVLRLARPWADLRCRAACRHPGRGRYLLLARLGDPATRGAASAHAGWPAVLAAHPRRYSRRHRRCTAG